MKKVVRIIARLNIGGPAIHTVLLTKMLDNRKYDSILVTGKTAKGEGDMLYFAKTNNVIPFILPSMSRELSFLSDFFSLLNILKIINRETPDIVHTHTAKAGALGRIAAILYNIKRSLFFKSPCKIIHTFHGHVFHSYFSRFKTNIFILIERFLALFTDVVVVISEKQKTDICEIFKIASYKKVRVIPLGFDLTKFYNCKRFNGKFRKDFNIDDETVLIGIVGRLVTVKNHRLFMKVAAKFKDKAINVRFLIIGDGELKDELIRFSDELKLGKILTFTGWIKEIDYVYDGLDVVSLTSFNEGTPVSLIEAMASSKPVISTDAGGVSDLLALTSKEFNDGIIYGNNGILVKQDDEDAYFHGLEILINNIRLRKDIGNASREYVKSRFSILRLSEDMDTLYTEISG